MLIHWPLVASTACQRAGLGLILAALAANVAFGAALPVDVAALAALTLLCAGGVASIFHLQRPARFFNAFSNPKSHLTQEGAITPLLGAALLVSALDGLAFDLGAARPAAHAAVAVLALAFLVCTGLAYQMKSRPAWNTPYVLALFLLTAAAAGCVGAALLAAVCASPALGALSSCAAVSCIACLAVQGGYVARMKRVGYRTAYDAFARPYRGAALTWLVCGISATALSLVAAAAPDAAAALLAFAWLVCIASVAAWTALFFKGAHKVKMFPMYAADLNLDM